MPENKRLSITQTAQEIMEQMLIRELNLLIDNYNSLETNLPFKKKILLELVDYIMNNHWDVQQIDYPNENHATLTIYSVYNNMIKCETILNVKNRNNKLYIEYISPNVKRIRKKN